MRSRGGEILDQRWQAPPAKQAWLRLNQTGVLQEKHGSLIVNSSKNPENNTIILLLFSGIVRFLDP